MGDNRVGYISSIDEKTGMVRVTYQDMDRSVTAEIPYFNHNGEYLMPKVNDLVIVVHMSNDPSMAVALGTFWNLENLPHDVAAGDFYKPLDQNGSCYIMQKSGNVMIGDRNYTFGPKDIKSMLDRIAALESGGE